MLPAPNEETHGSAPSGSRRGARPDATFGTKERLKKGAEFKGVLERGRRIKDGDIILWSLPNGLSCSRLGVSAPRRDFKLAARRNKARRLLKEAYRKNKTKLKQGFDIVIMLKGSIPALSELENKILNIFGEAGLLK